MPSVAELDRLQGLVTRLAPLTDARSGELIKADDWNAVVGALIETARAVVTSAEEGVPPHEHPDQVAVGWLDPRLRQLVEQGPLGDPAAVSRIGVLEGRVDRLASSLDALRDDVQKLRDLVTDVSTRDLAREAAVSTLHRTVDGLADARQDVLDVRATMRALQTQVQTASQAAAALKVNGQIVDVGDLASRVARADELRQRLTLPTGELLDTAELQKQLATLENSLVSQQQLDEALASHHAELSEDDKAALQDQVRTALLGDLQASEQQLADSVDARVGERLAAVDGQVARAVADATPGLAQSVLGTLRPEIAAAAQGAVSDAATAAAKAIEDATGALRTELSGQIADVRDGMAGAIADEVGRQLPAQLAPVSGRIDGLEGRLGPVEQRLSAQEAASAELGGRIDALAVSEANEREALRTSLLGTLDERFASLDGRFTDAAAAASAELDARIAASSASDLEAAKGLVSELEAKVPALVTAQLDPATAALREELSGQIDTAVKTATSSLEQELSTQTATLEEGLKALDGRLSPVESKLAEEATALSALDARLTPVETQLATQDKALADLTARVEPLETRIADAEQSIASLGGRLAPLEASVKSEQDALTALDARLTPVETQLADVESTMVTKDALAAQLTQVSATLHADATTIAQAETQKLRSELPGVVRTQLSTPVNATLIQDIAARRANP